jgi:hypothetical protein
MWPHTAVYVIRADMLYKQLRLCCGSTTALLQRVVRLCKAFFLAFFFGFFWPRVVRARTTASSAIFLIIFLFWSGGARARREGLVCGFFIFILFLFLFLLLLFGQEENARGAREGLFCEESSDALRLRLVLKYLICDWY